MGGVGCQWVYWKERVGEGVGGEGRMLREDVLGFAVFGEDKGFGLGVAVGGDGASAVEGEGGEFSKGARWDTGAAGECSGRRHFWRHCKIVVVVNWGCSSGGV